MGRKTIILREDQFNEICGLNTSYADNSNDYAEDGSKTVKAGGAVSDAIGEKGYSEPITGDEWGHELAPETLWALLFRNGGHGLWGHWGSGLRVRELTEENARVKNINLDDIHEPLYESNSELEGRSWNGDSYTNLTTKKTDLKKKLDDLIKQHAPEAIIRSTKAELAGVCRILDSETLAIKTRKKNRMNLGMENQFQRPGGTKNSGNGKAHTKKMTKDPNVGEGFITYR